MWLIVVYLHVWFLFVRLKQEGRDGEVRKFVSFGIVYANIQVLGCQVPKLVDQYDVKKLFVSIFVSS